MENENLINNEVTEVITEEVLDDLTLGQKIVKYELIGFAFVGAATTGYGIYKGVKAIYKHFKEKKSEVSEENEEPIVDVKNVESEETSEE